MKHLVAVMCSFHLCNYHIFLFYSCVYCSISLKCCKMGKKAELDNVERSKTIFHAIRRAKEGPDCKALTTRTSDHKRVYSIQRKSLKQWKTSYHKSIKQREDTFNHCYEKKHIYRPAGIFSWIRGITNYYRATRCKFLKLLRKVCKAKISPPLTKEHQEKRVQWAKTYLKIDFRNICFTDECRATLNGTDGAASGWLANDSDVPLQLRRQQGGGVSYFRQLSNLTKL